MLEQHRLSELERAPYGIGSGPSGMGPGTSLPAVGDGLLAGLTALNSAIDARDRADILRQAGIDQLDSAFKALIEREPIRIMELRRYNQFGQEGLQAVDLAISNEIIVKRSAGNVFTAQVVIDSTDNGGFETVATRTRVRDVHNLAEGGTAFGMPRDEAVTKGVDRAIVEKLYDNGMRPIDAQRSIDALCLVAEGHIARKISLVKGQQRRLEKGGKVENV